MRLLSHLKQSEKKDKKYETSVFKTLSTGQPRTGIPERWKTNEVSPTVAPAYYLKMISRQQQREKEPAQNRVDSPSQKDVAESPGRPRQPELPGHTPEDSFTEKPEGLQRASSSI